MIIVNSNYGVLTGTSSQSSLFYLAGSQEGVGAYSSYHRARDRVHAGQATSRANTKSQTMIHTHGQFRFNN